MFRCQDEDTRKYYVEVSFQKHWDDKNPCKVRKEYIPPNGARVLYFEAITTIGDALKAPVLATKKVLKAMEKVPEAKFWVWDDENRYQLIRPSNHYHSINDSFINGQDFDEDDDADNSPPYSKLQIGDYIQADCPLALQVLLGFTVEGEIE
jgi:hypothetical protein